MNVVVHWRYYPIEVEHYTIITFIRIIDTSLLSLVFIPYTSGVFILIEGENLLLNKSSSSITQGKDEKKIVFHSCWHKEHLPFLAKWDIHSTWFESLSIRECGHKSFQMFKELLLLIHKVLQASLRNCNTNVIICKSIERSPKSFVHPFKYF